MIPFHPWPGLSCAGLVPLLRPIRGAVPAAECGIVYVCLIEYSVFLVTVKEIRMNIKILREDMLKSPH